MHGDIPWTAHPAVASIVRMTTDRARFTVDLLADRQDLIPPLGALCFEEWGPEPGRERVEDWIAVVAGEAGRDGLPVKWVAADGGRRVLGSVGLAAHDLEQRRDRGPWIVGMLVDPAARRRGIGTALLARLEAHAVSLGADRVHVATGGAPAIRFYEACGWITDEIVRTPSGEDATVLVKTVRSDG
jgi:GNAT superfamily N-acetyltransferase